MGTNPAPHLADLDCYRKESTAMDQIASTNTQLAQSFFGTYRYIDDILSVDNPNFDSFVRLQMVKSLLTHQFIQLFSSSTKQQKTRHQQIF